MAVEEFEPEEIGRKIHNLAKTMEKTRSSLADRDDIVIDMKHARISRLELLATDLESVFNEIPKDSDQFDFALTNGQTPRLWIDMTSFVRMTTNGREYEFVKDTRLGRIIIEQSQNRAIVGEAITTYIAERLIERERMIEGEWIIAEKDRRIENNTAGDKNEKFNSARTETPSEIPYRREFLAWIAFLAGLAIGVGGLWLAIVSGEYQTLLNWWSTVSI